MSGRQGLALTFSVANVVVLGYWRISSDHQHREARREWDCEELFSVCSMPNSRVTESKKPPHGDSQHINTVIGMDYRKSGLLCGKGQAKE